VLAWWPIFLVLLPGSDEEVSTKPLPSRPPALVPQRTRTDEDRARDATVGYYTALVRGEHDVAGTFLHPRMIEPLRASLIAAIEKAPPGPRSATLAELGVDSIVALERISPAGFFAAYARSSYGHSVRTLADPALKPTIDARALPCTPAGCEVEVEITSHPVKEEPPLVVRHRVRAEKLEGRWLLTLTGDPGSPSPRAR
jgi:hypothetical protein